MKIRQDSQKRSWLRVCYVFAFKPSTVNMIKLSELTNWQISSYYYIVFFQFFRHIRSLKCQIFHDVGHHWVDRQSRVTCLIVAQLIAWPKCGIIACTLYTKHISFVRMLSDILNLCCYKNNHINYIFLIWRTLTALSY